MKKMSFIEAVAVTLILYIKGKPFMESYRKIFAFRKMYNLECKCYMVSRYLTKLEKQLKASADAIDLLYGEIE